MSYGLDEKVPRIEDKNIEDLEKKYGILLTHAKQIREYNRRLNWVIMLRPINKEVVDKLKSNARGKIISIKGKSSEFIFLAGDIPYEAGLSKLGKNGWQSYLSRINHFNSVNGKSINNSNNDEKVRKCKDKIESYKGRVIKKQEKVENIKQLVKEFQQQGEKIKSDDKYEEFKKEDLLSLSKFQQQINLNQQELEIEQQTLEKYIQEFNLNFTLGIAQKTVEINDKIYKCFYKVGENGHPEY